MRAVRRSADNRTGQLPVSRAARAVYWVYRGANITDACAATGVPRATWYQWLNLYEAWPDGSAAAPSHIAFAARLRHAFERAQGRLALKMQRTLVRASQTSVGTLDWRAAHEHLKHAEATRKRWHEHRELKIEQTGSVSHEHRLVREMSEAELLEGCSPDIAGLLS